MPLNINEAAVIFTRKAETLLEVSDGIRLGVQLVQSLAQRIAQLEKIIQDAGLSAPPTGTETAPPSVTPFPRPPQS